jgi:hypothetical protein
MDKIDEFLGLSDKIYYVNFHFTRGSKPTNLVGYRHGIYYMLVTLTPNQSETI